MSGLEAVAAAFGIVAAIPQVIESAKKLYDMRQRYKEASVTITAIYSESMVIAASLSQVQNLLQQDALRKKPLLHETFDRALTGCFIVYACLDEEVKELAFRAESDTLTRKDRAKYVVFKEPTFKELLQQIRGQQSALSLLIQGLQMESIAEIKNLVQSNSDKLDQAVKRSNTLRQSRPNMKVPKPIFEEKLDSQSMADAESILTAAEFSFDEEIINSAAYRRAMAMATLSSQGKEPKAETLGDDLDTLVGTENREQGTRETSIDQKVVEDEIRPKELEESAQKTAEKEEKQAELLDALEASMLPFMPPAPSISPRPTGLTVGEVTVPTFTSHPAPVPHGPSESFMPTTPSFPNGDGASGYQQSNDFQQPYLHQYPQHFRKSEKPLQAQEPSSQSYQPNPVTTSSEQYSSGTSTMYNTYPQPVAPSAPASYPQQDDLKQPPALPPRRPSRNNLRNAWAKTTSEAKNLSMQTLSTTTKTALQESTNMLNKTIETSTSSWNNMLTSFKVASPVSIPSTFSNPSSSSFSLKTRSSTTSLSSPPPSYSFDEIDNNLPVRRKLVPQSRHNSGDTAKGSLPNSLSTSRVNSFDKVEIEQVWSSLVDEEQKFVDRMTKFRNIFYDAVVREWPVLEKHLEVILIGEQIVARHRQFLLEPMHAHEPQSHSTFGEPAMFERWAHETQKLYREYCQRVPHAERAIRVTQNTDVNFSPFIGTLGLSIIWFGKAWDDYLRLPLTQVDHYVERLRQQVEYAQDPANVSLGLNTPKLVRAFEAITRLRDRGIGLFEQAERHEDIQFLYRRIHTLDTLILSQLELMNAGRRIIYQGGMAFKANSQGPWQSVHVVLLDNFMLWGGTKQPASWKLKEKRADIIWVLESPIPISNLEITLPEKKHQYERATFMDEIPRGTVLYRMFVRDTTSDSKKHEFGAYSPMERESWKGYYDGLKAGNT